MILKVSQGIPKQVSKEVTNLDYSTSAASPGTYGRVTAWMAKQVELALGVLDITLPQYRVLGLLAEGSAVSSALANRLAVRPPSVTAVVDGLVARKLVERASVADDRRQISLLLTDEGRLLIAAADEAVDKQLVAIASSLKDDEQTEEILHSIQIWGKALTQFHLGSEIGRS